MENPVIDISTLQIILTVGVAIAAFVSPVIVALINNRHARKIREAELKHDEKMKQNECEHSLSLERLNATFSSKGQIFLELIDRLSDFYKTPLSDKCRFDLISSMYKAALYCEDTRIQNNVFSLISDVKSGFSGESDDSLNRFQVSMETLVYALHFELSGSKPDEYTKD